MSKHRLLWSVHRWDCGHGFQRYRILIWWLRADNEDMIRSYVEIVATSVASARALVPRGLGCEMPIDGDDPTLVETWA